jgi:hypothetical protein
VEAPDTGTLAILAGAIVTLVTILSLIVRSILKLLTKLLVGHMEKIEATFDRRMGQVVVNLRRIHIAVVGRAATAPVEPAPDEADDADLVDEDPPADEAVPAPRDPALEKTPVHSIAAERRKRAGRYGPGRPGGKEG